MHDALSGTTSAIPIQGPEDFARALTEFQSRMGNYGWMFKILQSKARRKGYFPGRLYKRVRRFGNPKKPFFIGTTGMGTQFAGDYRDYSATHHMLFPDFNLAIGRYLVGQAKATPGAFLDIGTNLGVIATMVAQALDGRDLVVGFEPVEETALRAGATFALNKVKHLRLVRAAASDQVGELKFFATPGNSSIASMHKIDEIDFYQSWQETVVPAVTIDGVIDALGLTSVGFVKIDVEGAEPFTVAGGLKTFHELKPKVLFEYTPESATRLGWTHEGVIQSIAGPNRYRLEIAHDDGSVGAYPPVEGSTEQVNILVDPRGV